MQHLNIVIGHKSSCTLETYDHIHQNAKVHFIMLQRHVQKIYTQWWFQEGWDYHTSRLLNKKLIIVILKATSIFATMVAPRFAPTWFVSNLKATTPLGCVIKLKAQRFVTSLKATMEFAKNLKVTNLKVMATIHWNFFSLMHVHWQF